MRRKVAKKKPPTTSLAVQDDQALMFKDPVQRDQLLDKAARSGVKWIRANVYYGETQGGQDLSKLNALIDAAKARGLKVQATLSGDPDYKKPADSALSYKNPDPKLMAEFARTVAQQQRGRIDRYSIWNEPNYRSFLADQNPVTGGRTYRNLYRAGYDAIKSQDHSAQVMLGELTSQPNAQAFLKSVLAGKPLKTAGLAYHPYAGGGSEWDINNLPALQKTLAAYKRQGKLQTAKGTAAPLYLTEFGYQRGDFDDEGKRQKLLGRAYQKAQQAGARQMLYYQMTPTTRDPGAPAVADSYGAPGTPGRAADTSWKWDTSTDVSALRGYARPAVARAKVRVRR